MGIKCVDRPVFCLPEVMGYESGKLGVMVFIVS